MVKEKQTDNKKLYECQSYCLTYKDKKWAEKCEAWCKEHDSCNVRISCYSLEHSRGQK